MQQPRQLDRRERVSQLGVHRRREVLDVRHLDHLRLVAGLHPDRARSELAGDPPGDDPVLDPVLFALHQLLGEVIVDRGIGAAPGRAGECHGGDAGATTAHEQLGARAEKRRLGRADAEAKARREELAQSAEHAAGSWPRSLDRDLARQHDLVQLASADPRNAGGNRVLEVTRRQDARNPAVSRRARVEHRQRLVAQRAPAVARAVRARRRRCPPAIAVTVRNVSPPAAHEAQLREHQQRRRKRRPRSAAAAVRREREAACPDRARRRPAPVAAPDRAAHDRAHLAPVARSASPARDRPRGRTRARPARTRRDRAAPSRTNGRWPAARRRRRASGRRCRPASVTLTTRDGARPSRARCRARRASRARSQPSIIAARLRA